jgi:hypothetical protein
MPLVRFPEPFDHPDWLFEVKHDGFRALARITRHHCALRSRNGHTFKHWPQLCEKLAHAVKPHNAIIDGAIACLDKRGRSTSRICCFGESGHSSTPSTCSPLMGKKTSGTGRSSSASGDCAS